MASREDYSRAANAVQAGNATPAQIALNNRMAKQAGSDGNDARAANAGEKKW